MFLWRMSDVRARSWVQGRVALVGDAVAAFLPTAGVGASMALESAAVLADELSHTDAVHLPNALDPYYNRRQAACGGGPKPIALAGIPGVPPFPEASLR